MVFVYISAKILRRPKISQADLKFCYSCHHFSAKNKFIYCSVVLRYRADNTFNDVLNIAVSLGFNNSLQYLVRCRPVTLNIRWAVKFVTLMVQECNFGGGYGG